MAFIKCANENCYRPLLIELLNNYTHGQDQYPGENMTMAYNLLLINYKTQKGTKKKYHESDTDEDEDEDEDDVFKQCSKTHKVFQELE